MTLQELANLGQSQGFRIADNQIVGIHKGYAFWLTLNNKGNQDIITIGTKTDRVVPGKVRKSIKNSLPKGTKVGVQENSVLCVTCPTENSQDTFTVTAQALDAITQNLSSAKKPISNPARCPICSKDNCDSAALANGGFVRVHRQCVEDQNRKEIDSADQNQQSGNYFTGILGALLGAIAGCIPTIITIYAMQMEYGMLYALVPLASFAGYKLLKGRRGIIASIIVMVASILAFAIMKPVIPFMDLVSRGYSFSEVVTLYYFELPLADLLSDIWFGALFLIIGIVSSFRMMGTTNDDRIRTARASIDSVIPLTGQTPEGLFDNTGSARSSSHIDPWFN